MAKPTRIEVSSEQRETLLSWVRSGTAEQRMADRARMILAAAAGKGTKAIAEEMGTRPARVSKWRARFAKEGIKGLSDAPGRGRPRRYTRETERRVLSALDEPPPEGYACWNGRLVARHLGDVSPDQVWRVLRKHGIHLQRRRSWCVSTDPEFAPKAADVVGLYLDPPENAVVLCVDEKPSIQALERAQGWLRLPGGQSMMGFSDRCRRHGTTTLFAALEVATGMVQAGHFKRRRRREFLAFMNEVVAEFPGREVHVILDNLNTHKPKRDRWLARHPQVHFHYTPTNACWLNQIEIWFSVLSRAALRGASFTSPRQVRRAIDRFVKAYNKDAAPFRWRKRRVQQRDFEKRYADLCK